MAAINLLPGYGGQYTSAVITSLTANTAGADTIDLSKCGMFAISIASGGGGGTIQFQQALSFNPTTNAPLWINFATAITLASAGVNALFDITDGPFGMMRFLSTLTAGTAQLAITGWPIPPNF